MLLCLDVGNSNIFGGIFSADAKLLLRFRYETNPATTSDQLGIFLKNVLRENGIANDGVRHIAISSVVPSLDYSLHAACKKYFNIEPFILSATAKMNIAIKMPYPNEVGADLLAGAIAAAHYCQERDVIVVDLGTATTLVAVSAAREFSGVAIMAGMRLTVNALSSNTAKLFPVAIARPERVAGRVTKEAIQSGVYYGHLGAIKEIAARMAAEIFMDDDSGSSSGAATKSPIKYVLLGTGGFAHLFEEAKIFDDIKPDLLLDGLRLAYGMNRR